MNNPYAQTLDYSARELAECVGDFIMSRCSFDTEDLDPRGVDLALRQRARLIDIAAALADAPPRAERRRVAPQFERGRFSRPIFCPEARIIL